MKFLCLKAVIL